MNGFTFFKNYYEAISDPENELSEEEQGRLYNAIFAYMFDDEEPSLKGACKMAFNLIRPSLDKSKRNGKNGSSVQNETDCEEEKIETKSKQNRNQIENKSGFEVDCVSAFLEEERNKKREERKEKELPPYIPPSEGDLGEGENAMAAFFKEFPSIQIDIRSPGETSGVDFAVLAEKLRESPYLRSRYSLRWLIRNYPDIQRDFWRNAPAPMPYAFPPNNEEEERKRRLREIDERLKGVNLNADPGF